MTDFCRLCLISVDRDKCEPIDREILNLIESVAQIKIPCEQDQYQTICEKCRDHLIIAERIKHQITVTQKLIWDGGIQKDDTEINLHCHVCNNMFTTFFTLLRHINSDHFSDGHLQDCSFCNFLMSSYQEVVDEEQQIFNDVQELCDYTECQDIIEELPMEHALRSPSEITDNDDEDESKATNTDQSFAVQNISIRATVNPFQCHLCEKSYSRKDKLKLHLKNKHNVQKIPRIEGAANQLQFICPTCEKVYKSQHNFDLHLTTEHDPLPFQCAICTESFSQRRSCRTHERNCLSRLIVGNGEYKCLACQQLQSTEEDLIFHLATHSDCKATLNSPQSCTICAEQLPGLIQLAEHMDEKHTLVFNCSACKKVFLTSQDLKQHVSRAHAKPLECTICAIKVSRLDKLHDHMKTHTGYSCHKCANSFSSRAQYAQHSKLCRNK